MPGDRQTLFFSATLDGEAGRVAKAYTRDAVRHEHVPAEHEGATSSTASATSSAASRVDALVDELNDRDRDLALVFVRTKRGADRLVKKLGNEGINAVAMHGDKSQGQRERALARFEAGDVDTLVATDVAARGIDVDGISHVINFDPPEDRDAYTHRIGRTGRAGRTGIGMTFVSIEQSKRRRAASPATSSSTASSARPASRRAARTPRAGPGTAGPPRAARPAAAAARGRGATPAAGPRALSARPTGAMEVRAVDIAAVRPLRHRVLRPHQRLEDVAWTGDGDPLALHLAALDGDEVVAS